MMPPYKPVVSKAQSRKLFALANRGEIVMSEARGKTRAAKGTKLPEHVKHENRYGKMLRGR